MTSNLMIIRVESAIRAVSEQEALSALSSESPMVHRSFEVIDTKRFVDDYESGDWTTVDRYLQERCREILSIINSKPHRVVFLGMDEVPILLAIGAYLGGEHAIEWRDFDEKNNAWVWPEQSRQIDFDHGKLVSEVVQIGGDAVLAVEVSASIASDEIGELIPQQDSLAEIHIRPDGEIPNYGLIESVENVEKVRRCFRSALGAISEFRPNVSTLHLFAAASPSVCVAIGQELRLRDRCPVQTYRFRSNATPKRQPAILLTASDRDILIEPLTPEEQARAANTRSIWSEALAEIITYAESQEAAARGGNLEWVASLNPGLRSCYVGPLLPPIWSLVGHGDRVSEESPEEFSFNAEHRVWEFSDEMLLMMDREADGDRLRMLNLARAFFWHEYLHIYQKITRHTARDIGGFPNCLEKADYIADLYGILNQVDFIAKRDSVVDDSGLIKLLAQCIEDAINSFWTFEPKAPTKIWQHRRLRRYLNWYWRRAQVSKTKDLKVALGYVCYQPAIELGGILVMAGAQRVSTDLVRSSKSGSALEIALIDENSKMRRIANGVAAPIPQLLNAFVEHKRDDIKSFFDSLYDEVQG